jgi:hypothetical protein
MPELLTDPVVQSSAAPFLVGLVAAWILFPIRLAGLAAGAGFLAAVWMIGAFGLTPLTATRKIVLLGAAASALGVIADLAFKPTRVTTPALGVLFGAGSIWVFWSVLSQKPAAEAALLGAGVFAFVLWTVSLTASLHDQAVRAGAAGLFLGLGAGAAAVFSATALLGQYGLALGAACGAFLLLAMLLGERVIAGATLTLTASAAAAVIAVGAMVLAKLPWTSLAALALIPLAVRLPLPEKSPAWIQAILASLYALAPAAGALALAWQSSRAA